MMLDHLGHEPAGAAIMRAIEAVLARGPEQAPLTSDLGGTGATVELGTAIASEIEAQKAAVPAA